MKLARNFAIVAALAALVAFAPAGSNALNAFMVALMLCFLGAIGWAVAGFASRNELTLTMLTDRNRALLFGAAGVIVLLFTGADRFFGSGLGTVLWIGLLAGSIVVGWRVWREANTY